MSQSISIPVERDRSENSSYELFIGALTVISLVGMVVLLLLPADSAIRPIFQSADTLYCIIFLFDFLRNLSRAPVKKDYLLWQGIIDLLSSIPAIPALRLFRIFRIARIARFLKVYKSRDLLNEFIQRRAESALYLTILLALMLLIIGSSLVLIFESKTPDANILNSKDAFWWAYVTITTVGYGDHFPVTGSGRVIAMVLMTFGIGIFGVLTSFFSSIFLAPSAKKKEEENPSSLEKSRSSLEKELEELKKEVKEIKEMISNGNKS